MLNIGIALLIFYFFIALGCILMFLDTLAYYLLLPCFIYLLVLRFIYREANCITLQWKDCVITLAATVMFYVYYHQVIGEIELSQVIYIYLITFITTMMFVNTIRFKSLI